MWLFFSFLFNLSGRLHLSRLWQKCRGRETGEEKEESKEGEIGDEIKDQQLVLFSFSFFSTVEHCACSI